MVWPTCIHAPSADQVDATSCNAARTEQGLELATWARSVSSVNLGTPSLQMVAIVQLETRLEQIVCCLDP